MIDIADVKRLTLGPKDVLVVKVDAYLTHDVVDLLKQSFAEGFPRLANKIMILDKSMSLAVVEQESL